MTRLLLSALALGVIVTSSASSRVSAQQEKNQPGQPTIAKTLVLNRDRTESIPVTVQGSALVLPVEVTVLPPVSFASAAVAATRAVRQAWEYRQVTVLAGQDAAAAMNALGLDGWEAVSALNAGANSSTVWLLKRPR